MAKYKISQYAKMNNVGYRTVWNWVKAGKVEYVLSDTGRIIIVENENTKQSVAVYARVSSSENKDGLERQKQRLLDYCAAKGYPVCKVVTEIGSGLNDKRPKLEALLCDKTITVIVSEHEDRLARFGLNYVKKMMELDGRRIEVINEVSDEKADLMQDFVSIVTSFAARIYGQRRTKRQTEKLISELEKNKE